LLYSFNILLDLNTELNSVILREGEKEILYIFFFFIFCILAKLQCGSDFTAIVNSLSMQD